MARTLPSFSSRQIFFPSLWMLSLLTVDAGILTQAFAQPPLLEVELGGEKDRGLPIHWSKKEAILLKQDGSLRFIQTPSVTAHQITSEPFMATSSMALKGKLIEEFGNGYEVSTCGNYLFVTPVGLPNDWADRFTNLQGAFIRFMSTRGIANKPPEFPLIAIVYRSEQEFRQASLREGVPTSDSILGYYSIVSNRMNLFLRPIASGAWFDTSKTILHEATHQLAFNAGIHQRLSQTPLWVVEGLASAFEAEGIYRASPADPSSKLNQARLLTWNQSIRNGKHPAQLLASIIEDDRAFEKNADEAYAAAWALTYYLSERESSKYAAYMKHLSHLRPNVAYSKPQRIADFRNYVQSDLSLLAKNMERFLPE